MMIDTNFGKRNMLHHWKGQQHTDVEARELKLTMLHSQITMSTWAAGDHHVDSYYGIITLYK